MRRLAQREFLRMARDGLMAVAALAPVVSATVMAAVVSAHAQTPATEYADEARNRLLVAVLATRGGELIADETVTLTPYQRRREQDVTLDVAEGQTRASIVVTLHDRGYGGVAVDLSLVGVSGHAWEHRTFVMYPIGKSAATRTEVLRFPMVRFAEDGEQLVFQSTPIELALVLQKAPAPGYGRP